MTILACIATVSFLAGNVAAPNSVILDIGPSAVRDPTSYLASSAALDFDFFPGQPGKADPLQANNTAEMTERIHRRRWMLKTHQLLGMTTWALMAGTVTVGQLNYNDLYGGHRGTGKWQTPHRVLVVSTSALFAATATFAIFAPQPFAKPLQFDTGLIHRIAVIGASAGMITEGLLGWATTHQANAGNPHELRTMARVHQIVGYSTFGLLTIAGTVWLF
jgi:hypothetical protein